MAVSSRGQKERESQTKMPFTKEWSRFVMISKTARDTSTAHTMLILR